MAPRKRSKDENDCRPVSSFALPTFRKIRSLWFWNIARPDLLAAWLAGGRKELSELAPQLREALVQLCRECSLMTSVKALRSSDQISRRESREFAEAEWSKTELEGWLVDVAIRSIPPSMLGESNTLRLCAWLSAVIFNGILPDRPISRSMPSLTAKKTPWLCLKRLPPGTSASTRVILLRRTAHFVCCYLLSIMKSSLRFLFLPDGHVRIVSKWQHGRVVDAAFAAFMHRSSIRPTCVAAKANLRFVPSKRNLRPILVRCKRPTPLPLVLPPSTERDCDCGPDPPPVHSERAVEFCQLIAFRAHMQRAGYCGRNNVCRPRQAIAMFTRAMEWERVSGGGAERGGGGERGGGERGRGGEREGGAERSCPPPYSLSFAKLDIANCYDNIDQGVLARLVQGIVDRPLFIAAVLAQFGGVSRLRFVASSSEASESRARVLLSWKIDRIKARTAKHARGRSARIGWRARDPFSMTVKPAELIDAIREASWRHTMSFRGRNYEAHRGIRQGSIFSLALASLCLVERHRSSCWPSLPPHSLVVRYVDDLLFISLHRHVIEQVLKHYSRTVYGLRANPAKTETNIIPSRKRKLFVSFCGFKYSLKRFKLHRIPAKS